MDPKHPDPHLQQRTITVLLIDDQPIVAEAVRRMLKGEEDIELHYCPDAARAVQAAVTLRPTVILQDLVMPEMDGLTLVRYFMANAKTRDIPLIVLSSKEEPIVKARAFGLGASDYLVKLPDKIELIARIRHHSRGYISFLQRNEVMTRLAAELNEAADYVRKLLPAPISRGPILTDWRFLPSASLGGDTFDYYWLDDDHFAMYLLDVCGHGVGAALLSVSVMNVLRTQTLADADFRRPAQVLSALNERFSMENHKDMFFTIWYGVYSPSSRELVFAGGGHPPALLISPSAGGDGTQTTLLTNTNTMVGCIPDYPFQSASAEVPASSRLYLYSDGVYEIQCADGSMWDLEGFVEFMEGACTPGGQGEACLDRLWQHVRQMRGKESLEDDFSIVQFAWP